MFHRGRRSTTRRREFESDDRVEQHDATTETEVNEEERTGAATSDETPIGEEEEESRVRSCLKIAVFAPGLLAFNLSAMLFHFSQNFLLTEFGYLLYEEFHLSEDEVRAM